MPDIISPPPAVPKTIAERISAAHSAWFFKTINTIIANRVRAFSAPMPLDMLQQQLDLLRDQSASLLNELLEEPK